MTTELSDTCKRCAGMNGVHFLTCPTLRYLGDLSKDSEDTE